MIVIDAGVGVRALVDDGIGGDIARTRLRGDELAAPELFDLEVTSVLRRLEQAGQLPARRAEQALSDLGDLLLQRVSHAPLVDRCWELRHDLTPYDAAYVALAEIFDVVLVTSDARLANAPGPTCRIDLLASEAGARINL